MKGHCVSAEHHERCACVMQSEQQISKIFGELDQVARLGTNLHGMVARVYVGCGWPARL